MGPEFCFTDSGSKFADLGDSDRDDPLFAQFGPYTITGKNPFEGSLHPRESRSDGDACPSGIGKLMADEGGRAIRRHFHSLAIAACEVGADEAGLFAGRKRHLPDPVLKAIRDWSRDGKEALSRVQADQTASDLQQWIPPTADPSHLRLTDVRIDPEPPSTGVFACEKISSPEGTGFANADGRQSSRPLVCWMSIVNQVYEDRDKLARMHFLSNQLSMYQQLCGRPPVVQYLDEAGTELSWDEIIRLPTGSTGRLVVRPESLGEARAKMGKDQCVLPDVINSTLFANRITQHATQDQPTDQRVATSQVARGLTFTSDPTRWKHLCEKIGHYTFTNFEDPTLPSGQTFSPNPLEFYVLSRENDPSRHGCVESCGWRDGKIDEKHLRSLEIAALLNPSVSISNMKAFGKVKVESSLMKPILDWAKGLRNGEGEPLRCRIKTTTHEAGVGSNVHAIHSTTGNLHLCLQKILLPTPGKRDELLTIPTIWTQHTDSRFQGSIFVSDLNKVVPVSWHKIFDRAHYNPVSLGWLRAASVATHIDNTPSGVLVEYRDAMGELRTHADLANVKPGDTGSLVIVRKPARHGKNPLVQAGNLGTAYNADTEERCTIEAGSGGAPEPESGSCQPLEGFPVIGNQTWTYDPSQMADGLVTPFRSGDAHMTWAKVVKSRAKQVAADYAKGDRKEQREEHSLTVTRQTTGEASGQSMAGLKGGYDSEIQQGNKPSTSTLSWARVIKSASASVKGPEEEDIAGMGFRGQVTPKTRMSWAQVVSRPTE